MDWDEKRTAGDGAIDLEYGMRRVEIYIYAGWRTRWGSCWYIYIYWFIGKIGELRERVGCIYNEVMITESRFCKDAFALEVWDISPLAARSGSPGKRLHGFTLYQWTK